jgi:hypothetical protein
MLTEAEQAANKATGEMCDRIRNHGTLVDMVIISHEDLEALIQKRIAAALADVRTTISEIAGRS